MFEMALTLLVLGATAACAPASSSAHSAVHQQNSGVAPHTIGAVPTTVRVELDSATRDGLARALESRSLDVARLVLRDVRAQGGQSLKGVRLFVEKADADLSTPTDAPHYAGSFVLGFAPPETVLLNIAPTLSRLWNSGELTRAALTDRGFRLTFVPEPWEPARRLPGDFALTIQSLSLQLTQGRHPDDSDACQ
jgi:hypothetical protein